MLWTVVKIATAQDLLRLRDTFRAWPSLATHVRSVIVCTAPRNMRDATIEVVDQMSSLESFCWHVQSEPIAVDVCQALARLARLRCLGAGHLIFAACE